MNEVPPFLPEEPVPENQLSRREMLGMMAFGMVKLLRGTSLDSLLAPEIASLELTSRREELKLIFQSLSADGTNLAEELNSLWELFFTDHEPVSPGVLEGFYTKFGPSAVARGQLMIATDELRRVLTNGELSQEQLTQSQSNLLSFRDTLDASGIDQTVDVNSHAYTEAFITVLRQAGYHGIVAMKSPQDLGRAGFVEIYNKLTEQWSTPIPVICLNTADESTWRNWVFQHSQFTDFDGDYDAKMGWVIEVGDEIVTEGGTSFDDQNLVGGFIRYVDEQVATQATISFPETHRLKPELHPNMIAVADQLQTVLNGVNELQLQTIIDSLPPEFEHPFGGSTQVTKITQHSFVPYVIYEAGVFQGNTIPFFYGDDLEQLKNAMEHPANRDENRNGLPVGKTSIHVFFKELSRAGYFSKQILATVTDQPNAKVGIFFVESFVADGKDLAAQGIFYRDAHGQYVFSFLDGDDVLQQLSFAALWQQQIGDESMARIVVLGPSQTN